jgi:serine protease Do
VADLNKDARKHFEVPENVKGAVVTEVDPDSAAAAAGLKAGDVILEINRKPVADAQGAVQMTQKATDKTTLLRIWRAGASHFMVVDETKAG